MEGEGKLGRKRYIKEIEDRESAFGTGIERGIGRGCGSYW